MNLANANPEILLQSISTFFKFLLQAEGINSSHESIRSHCESDLIKKSSSPLRSVTVGVVNSVGSMGNLQIQHKQFRSQSGEDSDRSCNRSSRSRARPRFRSSAVSYRTIRKHSRRILWIFRSQPAHPQAACVTRAATASCSTVATHVYNIIKTATASGPSIVAVAEALRCRVAGEGIARSIGVRGGLQGSRRTFC